MNLERSAEILDALHVAVAVYSPDTETLSTSNRAFDELFRPDAVPANFSQLREHLDHGATLRVPPEPAPDKVRNPVVVQFRQGWYRLRQQRINGSDIMISLEDMTDQLELLKAHHANHEQLLFSARRMSAGEMTTTLAHELNQPLGATLNYLSVAMQLLSDNKEVPERLTQAVALAKNQTEHATDIVQRMREFVRSREPSRQPHRVCVLVDSVIRLLELEAQNHGIRIQRKIPMDLSEVMADRVMIEQVLLNLCRNAFEAMLAVPEDQRVLTITARRNFERDIAVEIQDTGPGLDDEKARNIFTPFVSGKSDGLGIGLSLCRSIIEYHQGRLYYEPTPGGGAGFTFTLTTAEE